MADMKTVPWWQWIPFRGWRIVLTVDAADEVPTSLPRNGAVLVGTERRPKWLSFDCPCGTGHRILIPLDPVQRPHWTISRSQPLSISPSVDYKSTRRCHYFISNGRTTWV